MPDDSRINKRIFDSLEQEAYLSLWRTYDRLKGIEDQFFSEHNITPQQYNVLRLLEGAGKPLPTLAIATRLVSRSPDITRMIDKLVADGWVERVRSDVDRREVLVWLTKNGTERLQQISHPLEEMHKKQLGHLTQEELRQLLPLLSKARLPHEPDASAWT